METIEAASRIQMRQTTPTRNDKSGLWPALVSRNGEVDAGRIAKDLPLLDVGLGYLRSRLNASL